MQNKENKLIKTKLNNFWIFRFVKKEEDWVLWVLLNIFSSNSILFSIFILSLLIILLSALEQSIHILLLKYWFDSKKILQWEHNKFILLLIKYILSLSILFSSINFINSNFFLFLEFCAASLFLLFKSSFLFKNISLFSFPNFIFWCSIFSFIVFFVINKFLLFLFLLIGASSKGSKKELSFSVNNKELKLLL